MELINKHLSDLINTNELPPSAKSYYFEKSVILLFDEYLKAEKQTLFTDYKIKGRTTFDAIIPSDFKELSGPILVEIKTSIQSNHLFKIKDSLKELPENTNVNTLLVVLGSPITKSFKSKLINDWKKDNTTSIKLVIWDIDDLEENFKNYNSILSNNISFLYLKNQTQESKTKQLSFPKDNLQKLKDIYKNEKIVLFLGSGVSKDCNLPLWDELIGGLGSEIISNLTNINYLEKKLLIKELSTLLQGSPLISASYLERGLLQGIVKEEAEQANSTFYTKLKDTLYKNYIDNINEKSQLHLIAQGIVNSSPSNGIKGVITYNYDDILQKHLHAIDNQYKIQSSFNDASKEPGFFPIYHVHGFLPFNESNYSDYKIEEQDIIFTESSYHKLQADVYSWRNLVQINALRDDTVVMLGLSVTDPNLRRLLLYTSQRPERKHFVFLQRYSLAKSDNLGDLDKKVSRDFLNVHHSILEESFEKLGVNVIWYDEHHDIPGLLAELFGIYSKQVNS